MQEDIDCLQPFVVRKFLELLCLLIPQLLFGGAVFFLQLLMWQLILILDLLIME